MGKVAVEERGQARRLAPALRLAILRPLQPV